MWIEDIRLSWKSGYKCGYNGHEILEDRETWMMATRDQTGEPHWYCLEHGLPLFNEVHNPSDPMPGGRKDDLLKKHHRDAEYLTPGEAQSLILDCQLADDIHYMTQREMILYMQNNPGKFVTARFLPVTPVKDHRYEVIDS